MKEYRCICQLFVEKEGFLPPTLGENEKPWLNTIINYPGKMHLAIVRYLKTDVIMSVHATLLDAKKEIYVVTLSDVTQMHRMQEQFRHEALIDRLTGAFNRTKFDAVLDSAILNASKKPFTMALLDIDHFKQVNDDFGHLVGDSALKELVILIQDNIRNEDLLARWGGEEFVLIFFTTWEKIIQHIEKLRILVEEHPFSGVDRPITISIGVGEYKPEMGKDSFLKLVDGALYRAKQSGRNCVVEVEVC